MPANWIAFARRDLAAAEILLREGILEEACFHSQQTAEKALKAFLLHHGQPLPRTHDLPDLLHLCSAVNDSLKVFQLECATLSQFYLPTRYPDSVAAATVHPPDPAQTQRALDYARAILKTIDLLIFPQAASSPPPSERPV